VKQNIILILAALVALLAGMGVKYYQLQQQPPTVALPDIQLPDSDGKIRRLDEWQGKILIINFWATWCPPCLTEIPEFVRLQTELAKKNVQFIGIAVEDQASVVAFLQKNPVNYPMLIGGDAAISLSQQLGNLVNAIPFTLIIDAHGMIVYRHPGELSRETLLEQLQALI
jgi:peroxiredoxin